MPSRSGAQIRRGRRVVALLVLLTLFAVSGLVVLARLSSPNESGNESSRAKDAAGARPANAGTSRREIPTPSALRVTHAAVFARARAGSVSFAVVDTSGTLRCYRCRVRYDSASVVKAMLLVSYLNRLAEHHEPLTPSHHASLDAMILSSDNSSATAIYRHVGDVGLYRLADRAEMRDFDVSGNWATAQITAADQARFFARIERICSPKYWAYTRTLLESIARSQAWGIPEVSRPRWKTFFKGGWKQNRSGSLVHQVARLERAQLSVAIGVLTDGNPSEAYGRATIRGIAARLIGS
jgi:hypothetical protein